MTVLRLVPSPPPRPPEWTLENVISVLDYTPFTREFGSARCPAHDDRWGTLALCEIEPGDIAFHCTGGCSEESIRTEVERRMQVAA